MSKITYQDKVTLNENPDIADINKCRASDLNEIKQVVNNNDDYTTEKINGIIGTVLWNNPNPGNQFSNTTLNIDFSNYDFYEILYRNQNLTDRVLSTGKIPINSMSSLIATAKPHIRFREITAKTQSSITISTCYYYPNYGNTSGTVSDDYCIPVKIIGYKMS